MGKRAFVAVWCTCNLLNLGRRSQVKTAFRTLAKTKEKAPRKLTYISCAGHKGHDARGTKATKGLIK